VSASGGKPTFVGIDEDYGAHELIRRMNADVQALSEREKETLRLLLEGHDAKSNASNLGISVHTVNERLRTARRKLGVSSSREAARILARPDQGNHNFLVGKQIGVVADAKHVNEGRRRNGSEGVKHPVALAIGGTLIMSLIVATAMLAWVSSGSVELGPLPNWRTATTTSTSSKEPTNTVHLDGNRLLWNDVETSEATIQDYLGIIRQMKPQPVLILRYSARTSPKRVHGIRLLIDGAIQCNLGRCLEIAIRPE
jgi:DNA-binding CsgD family transcriptional regulator